MILFPATSMTVAVLPTGNEGILLLVKDYKFLLWRWESINCLRGIGL